MTRRAATKGSFDSEAMVITAVVASGSPVGRRDARSGFNEVLDVAGARLPIDVPLLDSHNQGRAAATIGRAFNFRREGDVILADIRFSTAPDVQPIVDRFRDGTLNSFSVGYRVSRWEDTNAAPRVRTAKDWEIFEVSVVSIGADPNARKRSGAMDDETDVIDAAAAEPTIVETRAAIRGIARTAGLPTTWADEQIDNEATVTEARAAAFEAMQARTRRTPAIRTAAPVADGEVRFRAMEDALAVRTTGALPIDAARAEAARPFVGHSLRDFAREALTLRGVSTTGMSPDELFRAAMHTTTDFPNLLTGAGRRSLLASYQAAQSVLKSISRQGSRVDFRSGSTIRLGELGALQRVSEAGEIKATSRAETAESYAIDTYGAIFSISRKALVNDDLGAFNDWSRAAGQAAATTEANLLYGLLSQSSGAGPTMSDGKRLFHADHGNTVTSATLSSPALSIDALSAARLALRLQTGVDGKTRIAATPKYLVVGPKLETLAEQVLAALSATTTDGVNPFSGKLTLLVEPRITDVSWYVFADPAQLPVLEYSYLASAPGPQLSEREGWDVLSREFRVFEDFGAGAIDWRGAVRSSGVS
ncbi:prohead protease/major capsid protein fusion protein [Hansschlegelia plantiphila]|nr:prohead protease/major capsid protein fusion protein [Hansschlegelia plantiphila]